MPSLINLPRNNVFLNLFAQTSQPTTYDGFWVNTSNAVNKVAQVDDFLSQWNETFITKLGISVGSAGIAISGTKAYIIGGAVAGGTVVAVATVWIYDFLTNKFTQGTDMPVAKRNFACGEESGKIYCVGGSNATATAAQNSLYIYDIASDSWTQGANLPISRSLTSGCVYNGILYCFGGWNTSGSPQNTTYIYNISSNTWSTGTVMTASRALVSCVAYNGNIYVMGGMGTSSATVYSTNYIYNIAGNSWSTGTSIPAVRYVSGKTYYNGNIYLIGGSTTGGGTVPTNYIYNIAGNSWSTGVAMPAANLPLLVVYNDLIYCFNTNNTNYIYSPDGVQSQLFANDTLIIQAMPTGSNQPFKTILLESNSFVGGYLQYFSDLLVNGVNADIYYGDGTQWVKIRSAV